MKHLIDGQLVKGRGELFTVFNPATEEVIAQFSGIDGQQAEQALQAAASAFQVWSHLSLKEREGYILKFAGLIEANRDKIIDIIISETGKSYEGAE